MGVKHGEKSCQGCKLRRKMTLNRYAIQWQIKPNLGFFQLHICTANKMDVNEWDWRPRQG